MKPIGGYFELELKKGANCYHDTPYAMKSGRSSLQYILTEVRPELVYIPYFTCKVVLEPLVTAGIKYKFYNINELWDPREDIVLGKGEYLLYINYLDLKRKTVSTLSEKYKDKLIVDCTQAFYMKGNGVSWFFNSCRKFFGVPDGAYLYPPAGTQLAVIEKRNEEYIYDHLISRFNGHTTEGYESFLRNEVLAGPDILGMSRLSEYLLSAIDYNEVAAVRCENYNFLHEQLKGINLFNTSLCDGNIPNFYPLLLDDDTLRLKMIDRKIYIGMIWPHIDKTLPPEALEHYLASHLLPLPVDHRYNKEDMNKIVEVILSVLN